MRKGFLKQAAIVLSIVMACEAAFTNVVYAEPVDNGATVVEEVAADMVEEPANETIETEEAEVYEDASDLTLEDLAETLSDNTFVRPSLNYDDSYQVPALSAEDAEWVGAEVTIPASYRAADRSDLTPVRFQNPYGTCWAFSALGAGEQTYLKNNETGHNVSNIDLAEIQIAWFTYLDNTFGLYGDTEGDKTGVSFKESNLTDSQKAFDVLNTGGNALRAAWTLARGVGGGSEITTPELKYTNYGTHNYESTDARGVDERLARVRDTELEKFIAVNIQKNPEYAKQMIMEYGALSASYYDDDSGWVNTPNQCTCYYNPIETGGNHAITVVGWDDNYKVSNFNGIEKIPEHDGAWLIKNSWSTRIGDQGYVWMSYETKSLANAFVVELDDVDNSKRNYQYDGTSSLGTIAMVKGDSFCNVFTASGSGESGKTEVIDEVGMGFDASGVDYAIQIYRNPVDAANPTSGTKMLGETGQTGHMESAGFYSIPLNTPVKVGKGEKFAVVVTLLSNNARFWTDEKSTDEMCDDGGHVVGRIFFENECKRGQSFHFLAGTGEWTDASEEQAGGYNPRIKAYAHLSEYVEDTAVSVNKASLTLTKGQTEQLFAVVSPMDATEKMVSWKSSNTNVVSVDSDGVVTAKKAGNAVITATSFSGHQAFCKVIVTERSSFLSIYFDAANGEDTQIQNYDAEDTLGDLPKPTYGGRIFNGWYTEADGQGTKVTEDTLVSTLGNYAVLYADWTYIPCDSIQCTGSVSVNKGKYTTNRLILNPTNATVNSIQYQSMDTDVFTIDQKGRIKAVAYGSARGVITANVVDAAGKDVIKKCYFGVSVNDPIEQIEAEVHKKIVRVGSTVSAGDLKVYAYYQSGKRIQLNAGDFTITPAVVEKEGANEITVTSGAYTAVVIVYGTNDTVSRNEEDYRPQIQQETVKVNGNWSVNGIFSIEPAWGTDSIEVLEDFYAEADNAESKFEGLSIKDSTANQHIITVNDSTLKGKQKLYVYAIVEADGQEYGYYLPIQLQIANNLPKTKAKASSMNVFYTDTANRTSDLSITVEKGIQISSVEIRNTTGNEDFANDFIIVKNETTGNYSLQYHPLAEKTDVKEIPSKGRIVVFYKDYRYGSYVDVTVPVKLKAPTVKAVESTAVLNLYQNTDYSKEIQVKDSKGNVQKLVNADFSERCAVKESFETVSTLNGAAILTLKADQKASFKKTKAIQLDVRANNWLYARPVSFKYKVTESKPAVKLSAKTITLNKSYGNATAMADISFNTNLGADGYTVSAGSLKCIKGNAATAPKLYVTQKSNTKFQVKAVTRAAVESGNYTFTIAPSMGNEQLSTLKLKVKVVENKKAPAISLKVVNGGKLDVILGEDAAAYYAVNIKNLDAKVTGVSVGEADTVLQAEMVTALDGKQLVKITPKENQSLTAKQNYKLTLKFTVMDIGNKIQELEKSQTVKTIEGKTKIAVTMDSVILSKKSSASRVEGNVTLLSPDDAEFTSITCQSVNAPENAFYIYCSCATGKIRIVLRDDSLVKEGKTYTFLVKAVAGDGTKGASQKIKVKIAK